MDVTVATAVVVGLVVLVVVGLPRLWTRLEFDLIDAMPDEVPFEVFLVEDDPVAPYRRGPSPVASWLAGRR